MINCKDLTSITPPEREYILNNLVQYCDGSLSDDLLNKYFLDVKENYCKIHKK